MKTRTIVGCTIALLGAAIFLYPTIRELNTEKEVAAIIENFKVVYNTDDTDTATTDSSEESDEETNEETNDAPYADLYEAMIEYNIELFETDQEVLDAFGGDYVPVDLSGYDASTSSSAVGYIEIPAIDCTLPLYIGTSDENLAKGAAVMGNTSMPIGGENTNCVIAGHRGYLGSAFFRNLNQLIEGDLIYITNPWETMAYEVVSMWVTVPTDITPLLIEEGQDMITLVTCDPYMIGGGPDRLIVQAVRTDMPEGGTSIITLRNDTGTRELTSDDILILTEDILRVLVPILLIAIVIITLIRKRKSRNTLKPKKRNQ